MADTVLEHTWRRKGEVTQPLLFEVPNWLATLECVSMKTATLAITVLFTCVESIDGKGASGKGCLDDFHNELNPSWALLQKCWWKWHVKGWRRGKPNMCLCWLNCRWVPKADLMPWQWRSTLLQFLQVYNSNEGDIAGGSFWMFTSSCGHNRRHCSEMEKLQVLGHILGRIWFFYVYMTPGIWCDFFIEGTLQGIFSPLWRQISSHCQNIGQQGKKLGWYFLILLGHSLGPMSILLGQLVVESKLLDDLTWWDESFRTKIQLRTCSCQNLRLGSKVKFAEPWPPSWAKDNSSF